DQIVRHLEVSSGSMRFRMECRPAFDYARAPHHTFVGENCVQFDGPGISLGLAASVPLQRADEGVTADFVLGEGQSAVFILRLLDPGRDAGCCPDTGEADQRFRETVTYWQRWLSRSTYHGRWREVVQRSALVLKLLTYEPTGALVAAP